MQLYNSKEFCRRGLQISIVRSILCNAGEVSGAIKITNRKEGEKLRDTEYNLF